MYHGLFIVTIDYLYHSFTTNIMVTYGYCTETMVHLHEKSTDIVLIKLS